MKFSSSQAAALLNVREATVQRLFFEGLVKYYGPPARGRIGKKWTFADVVRIHILLLLSRSGLLEREAGRFVQEAIDDRLVGQILAGERGAYILIRRKGPDRHLDLVEGVGGDLVRDADSVSTVHLNSVIDSIKAQI